MLDIQDARARWKATFGSSPRPTPEGLKASAGLRSVCWKTWLLLPTTDKSSWCATLAASRSAFEDLRSSYMAPFNLERADDGTGVGLDPLAEDEANPWDRYRRDEELRAEIVQDVERCMPDVGYFRGADVQQSLLDVLFVYCKLNEDLGYRQGMHEIVAVILWVLSGDAVSALGEEGEGEEGQEGEEEMLRVLCDERYVEHDTFSLFQVVMRSAKAWYELGEEGEGKGRGRESRGRPPIVEKSRWIHEHLVMAVDPELGNHLKALDVLPQVFLIRWIRLLFGREFPLNELIEVWDCLFAEDPGLQLVDYICVAMLLRIRWQLVTADYSTALTLVLRYPAPAAPHPPRTFVADALHLRSNLTFTGGKHIITLYSDRPPKTPLPPRPAKPTANNTTTAASRTKSPIGSPTRFIPGVQLDSVLSDVTRTVLDRGEKWGVNRTIGRAVGEVKKNVQGFQQQQQAQWAEASKELAKEEELVKRSRALSKKLKLDEERRRLLEKALGAVIDALEQEPLGAVERASAIERLKGVRACLADSTKVVGPELLETIAPGTPGSAPGTPVSARHPPPSLRRASSAAAAISPLNPAPPMPAASSTMVKVPSSPPGGFVKTSFKNNSDPDFLTHKPRSSLAQSSFAWMLGDDPAVKAKTGFVAGKGKSGGSGGSGVGGSGEMVRVGSKDGKGEEEGAEGFDLGSMEGRKGKEE
ncbi:rab-GTPase-TBC domain-containing protein [Morchella snyderi]|nr:rab-GTPase-TBC domain-containing protein [Morchella snyderi]